MRLAPGALVLHGFAVRRRAGARSPRSWARVDGRGAVGASMLTPGGRRMSVAMTNCGALGWVTDRTRLPLRRRSIPTAGGPGPRCPRRSARSRTRPRRAGFAGFAPDACLINRYEPGARLSLHQDRDERDFAAPIVSVSLGLPAVFLFGGDARTDRAPRVRWPTATSSSGAGRRGCATTACCR